MKTAIRMLLWRAVFNVFRGKKKDLNFFKNIVAFALKKLHIIKVRNFLKFLEKYSILDSSRLQTCSEISL